MALVGKPCGRPSCQHGQGLHDEEGCVFCSCGYFLQADLMTHTRAALVMADAKDPYQNQDWHLMAFLTVVEGWSPEKAHAVIKGHPHRNRKSREQRVRAIGDALSVQS